MGWGGKLAKIDKPGPVGVPCIKYKSSKLYHCVSACVRVLSEVSRVTRLPTQYSQKIYRPEICITGLFISIIHIYNLIFIGEIGEHMSEMSY